jgi:hypothetical protein
MRNIGKAAESGVGNKYVLHGGKGEGVTEIPV